MKVLITGAGTILGHAISKYLLSKNFKVIATYRKSYPKLKKNKNLKIMKLDLTKKIFLKTNYDVLVHCASAIPADNFSKKKMFETNFYGFKKLLTNAIKNKCKKVILISSLSVYGKINKREIDERYRSYGLDYYGLSKLKMEEYLLNMSRKAKLKSIILRLSGIVGKNSHSFLSKVLKKIQLNQKIIFSNPNLKFNSFIHVDNFAVIIYNLIKKQNENIIFNIGTKYPIKLKNIVLKIFKNCKKKPNYKIIKTLNKGFSIKLSEKLKKKCNIYSTKKTLDLFLKQNL